MTQKNLNRDYAKIYLYERYKILLDDCAFWATSKSELSLMLLTPDLIQKLLIGTRLQCINGQEVMVGKDYIDLDTRLGFTAFGFYIKADTLGE